MPPVRRLTAILAADLAGYSRLMRADEEGTHERLKAHLRELIEPKIAEHRGRTVKNTGDGFLAEFSSVIDAVRCAVETQHGMIDREPELPEDRRIRFRARDSRTISWSCDSDPILDRHRKSKHHSLREPVMGQSKSKHILLVEDYDTVRELIANMLEDRSYRVSTVPAGASMRDFL